MWVKPERVEKVEVDILTAKCPICKEENIVIATRFSYYVVKECQHFKTVAQEQEEEHFVFKRGG